MSNTEILNVFSEKLTTVTGLITPSLPIKFPGITFIVPDNGKYWELLFIPNNGADRYWGSSEVSQGIFRVILHWPLLTEGVFEPMTLAATLAALIPKGTKMVQNPETVLIYQNPKVLQPVDVPPEQLFPISFWYRTFKP